MSLTLSFADRYFHTCISAIMGILIKFCNEKGEKGKENEFSKIVPSQMAMDLIKGFKTLITMPPNHSDSKNDFNTLHFSRIYRSYHEGRRDLIEESVALKSK